MATAKKRCPWAELVVKVENGFNLYESLIDYLEEKNIKVDAMVKYFKTRKEAIEIAKTLVGYQTLVMKYKIGYIIKCNGVLYLRENGAIR